MQHRKAGAVALFMLASAGPLAAQDLVAGAAAAGTPARRATGATILSVTSSAIGPSPAPQFPEGVEIRKATKKCGPTRLCPRGWDLAAIDVGVGPTVVARDSGAVVRVRVTNRGARPAPEAPLQVQFAGTVQQVLTPPLASGDTLVLGVRFATKETDSHAPSAEVDPERLSGDSNAVNNSVSGTRVRLEVAPNPTITADAPTSAAAGAPLTITYVVQNTSVATWLTNGSLEFRLTDGSDAGRVVARVPHPPIAPQTEARLTVRLDGFTTTRPGDPRSQRLVEIGARFFDSAQMERASARSHVTVTTAAR